MAVKRYTAEQLRFIEIGYRKMGIPDLALVFNQQFDEDRTAKQIHFAIKNHGFKCGRSTAGLGWQSKLFTREQAAQLADAYKTRSRRELTQWANETFGLSLTVSQVVAFVKNHGIKSGRDGQIQPGTEAWNKGSRGLMKPNRTSFKKGQAPQNMRPMGAERTCTRDGYLLIKVPETNPHTGADSRFMHKHRWIWEQAHGHVPDGMVVAFKDGNKLNCALDNLELMSRPMLARLNMLHYAQAPEELRSTIKTIAKLQTKAAELARRRQ